MLMRTSVFRWLRQLSPTVLPKHQGLVCSVRSCSTTNEIADSPYGKTYIKPDEMMDRWKIRLIEKIQAKKSFYKISVMENNENTMERMIVFMQSKYELGGIAPFFNSYIYIYDHNTIRATLSYLANIINKGYKWPIKGLQPLRKEFIYTKCQCTKCPNRFLYVLLGEREKFRYIVLEQHMADGVTGGSRRSNIIISDKMIPGMNHYKRCYPVDMYLKEIGGRSPGYNAHFTFYVLLAEKFESAGKRIEHLSTKRQRRMQARSIKTSSSNPDENDHDSSS